MKNKWLIVIPIVLIVGIFASYKYIYKNHRDISSEEADFTLSVGDIQKEFIVSDSLANAKYADKTIIVSGKVTSVDSEANAIMVNEKLSATMQDKIASQIKPQQQVKIKGRFVGYDDLLEELKMDQVTLIN